ncbi:MAG: stage V sporulation protein AE [Ruminiclostridium sp.]|nr:stage V sporulation protein AE [Ruminiclostridium sp.]
MEYLWAFLAGGALCAIGQLLIDLTSMTPARILVTYVVAGVFLGAVGIYEPFAKFAGAGATVPLTGFGYLLAKGVRDAVTNDGLIGALTGGLEACAGGVTAAVLFALIVALLFSRGDKTAKIVG